MSAWKPLILPLLICGTFAGTLHADAISWPSGLDNWVVYLGAGWSSGYWALGLRPLTNRRCPSPSRTCDHSANPNSNRIGRTGRIITGAPSSSGHEHDFDSFITTSPDPNQRKLSLACSCADCSHAIAASSTLLLHPAHELAVIDFHPYPESAAIDRPASLVYPARFFATVERTPHDVHAAFGCLKHLAR